MSLSYDSGAGNGPFGFGWGLSLPSIDRKTDKSLPRYIDAEESDIFILSGAEDLVPALEHDLTRHGDSTSAPGYLIQRYRPRIEGLFSRIERWTRLSDGDVHWRSISKDNILTLYGADHASRVADPADRRRIFRWLICESRDDRGNAILYQYKAEDGEGGDLLRTCERNRGALNDTRRTANRHLKRIRYGNREPLLTAAGRRPQFLADLPGAMLANAEWLFELVFDYGEHDTDSPAPDDPGPWAWRADAFSSYRAGFEVRTARLCQRALMFHHFADLATGESGYDGLVRSTDFTYSPEQDPANSRNPVYAFLRAVTQCGYRRRPTGGYEKRELPPVEFDYSEPVVVDAVEEIDPRSLENLPAGVDGTDNRWIDLHGEGLTGILAERAGAFLYKRNLSALAGGSVEFGPLQLIDDKPNVALAGGRAQFADLAGDGLPDLVVADGAESGFYEHDEATGWRPFRSFVHSLSRDTRDPNSRLVDLDGDGRADLLITEDDALIWHPSLGEEGYGPAVRIAQALDEEKGPRLVFADAADSIHLADMSGDGLTDLVRIRNGEICYWPNLGYGRFGAKVTMDNAPRFDAPDLFDHRRLRLADIDGSGTTDLAYLSGDGVRLYFNQSGNGWAAAQRLKVAPRVDNIVSIELTDLLGNGTACLVWSSPLARDGGQAMRYVNLMGIRKPHLLVRTVNNLGAETRIDYAPSTKFYLQDEQEGRPWLTRLAFPVHVVERVETIDHISRNRFVTRYAYHHGYFDGEEREFRGFGMVEQWDTEELAALTADGALNVDPTSNLPPVLTRTWFHTGVHFGRQRVSDFFAGLLDGVDKGEYYREPGLTDAQARALLLDDTLFPPGLPAEEEREASRALKGSMLRQEVYARDGSAEEDHPYTVLEQNFGVRLEQPRAGNRHAVFFTHPREAITFHYERAPADPRVAHALTLEVDAYGNVTKAASIAYGRRQPDAGLPLQSDRDKQAALLATYTESGFSAAIDDAGLFPGDYRAPLPCETRTYELTGYAPTGPSGRFRAEDLVQPAGAGLAHLFDGETAYEAQPGAGRQRRSIEHVRTLYRADDLAGLLPLGALERRALPGESYKLAFTPGLLAQVFEREGQALLPNPGAVLGGQAGDRGGYLSSQQLKADGRFPAADPDDHWWIPSGRTLLSPNAGDSPAQELGHARNHFFLARRTRDPFHSSAVSTESSIRYDAYDLLPVETRDAVGNRVTVGQRKPDGTIDPAVPGNDYRVLQPVLVTDPNGNRSAVTFDALGMVVGTAAMGKPGEGVGDSLAGLIEDLPEAVLLAHLADPLADPAALIGAAGTRLAYDLFAYQRTRGQPQPQPVVLYAIARETHVADLAAGEESRFQHSFSYSDGFGREIQKKIQAEPGPLADGGPDVSPRWVGTGWTVFNNKGKPVRQFEPFFSATPAFEFGLAAGVSPILFYDPLGRAVATLHPNHSYEKIVFDAWRQVSWDVNDTVLADPRTDGEVAGYMAGHFAALAAGGGPPWATWHALRSGGALGPLEQAAATKTAAHAGTPTAAHFDSLGRPFLTLADNGPDPVQPGQELFVPTRVELDIEGNQREIRDAVEQASDARGRIVVRYRYDMLGNRVHQAGMDMGERWNVADAAGKPLCGWDGRGHDTSRVYDPLRRPLRILVTGTDAANPGRALLIERTVFGEQHPDAEARNLRNQVWLHFDQAGLAATDRRDFKGNAVAASRRLTGGTLYRMAMDWTSVDADHVALPPSASAPSSLAALAAALAPLTEAEAYDNATRYDALNRPVSLTTPHVSTMTPSEIRPAYNEANLLERIDVNLRGAISAGAPVWTAFVTGITYDASGRRLRIDLGNGASSFYEYDPLTFRLTRLLSRRNAADFAQDCPTAPVSGWPGCQIQDLRYTYDPIGNVTQVEDRAQQAIFFANRRVEPNAGYRYDPLYRLIEAQGREHLGLATTPIPHDHDDSLRTGLPQPGDGNAMGAYVEGYLYDAVGNLLEMQHRGTNPAHPGWTRSFEHLETSRIEDGVAGIPLKYGNRLSGTRIGAGPLEPCRHDAHGNIVRLPHLAGIDPAPNLGWDYRDQLHRVDLGGGGVAFHVYDSVGQRIRRVWEKSATLVEERVYLGAFEIFRRRRGVQRLEREILHILDDQQRIALVETRTVDTAGTDRAPAEIIRYQLGNHLGSTTIELDRGARLVSYEEYSPYGSTTYQAARRLLDGPKRYRFTGKERDEESGLYYHGARHYSPWLGQWTSCDPSAEEFPGLSSYGYCFGNPLVHADDDGKKPTSPPPSAPKLVPPQQKASNPQQASPQSASATGNTKPLALGFYGGARVVGHNGAFKVALQNTQRSYADVYAKKIEFAASGTSVVKTINTQKENSIGRLDIVTHASETGIYMYRHEDTKATGEQVTIPKEKGEGNSLYSSKTARALESWGNGPDQKVITDIDFSRFTKDAVIELHGCKVAATPYEFVIDNLAENLSEELFAKGKTDAVVIGHVTKANPNIKGEGKTKDSEQDYRHGVRVVFHEGKELFRTSMQGHIGKDLIKKYLDLKQAQGSAYPASKHVYVPGQAVQ